MSRGTIAVRRAGQGSPPASVGVGLNNQPQPFVAFPATRMVGGQYLGSVWRAGGTADAQSVLRSGHILLDIGVRGGSSARRCGSHRARREVHCRYSGIGMTSHEDWKERHDRSKPSTFAPHLRKDLFVKEAMRQPTAYPGVMIQGLRGIVGGSSRSPEPLFRLPSQY